MKKLAIATLLLAGASVCNADYRVVNADGSEISELCVAAAASRTALQDTASSMGLSTADLATVRCNGLTLNLFASKYGSTARQMNVGYILKKSDESPVTELCIAAASSTQDYAKVKAMYFTEAENVEAEVMCNGMPLRTFARKYRSNEMTVSLR